MSDDLGIGIAVGAAMNCSKAQEESDESKKRINNDLNVMFFNHVSNRLKHLSMNENHENVIENLAKEAKQIWKEVQKRKYELYFLNHLIVRNDYSQEIGDLKSIHERYSNSSGNTAVLHPNDINILKKAKVIEIREVI